MFRLLVLLFHPNAPLFSDEMNPRALFGNILLRLKSIFNIVMTAIIVKRMSSIKITQMIPIL